MANEFTSYPDTKYGGTATVEVKKDQYGRQMGHMTVHGNGVVTDYTNGEYQNGKKVSSPVKWPAGSAG